MHKQRIKMKEQSKFVFYRFYKGQMMAFDLPESAFMVYMADLNEIRKLGYNTLRPLRTHLGCLGIGRRSFERCIMKTTSMGLLKRVAVDGKYDYFWDMEAYNRLIQIVSTTTKYTVLREFCNKAFEKDKRTVMSITYDEIQELSAHKW